MEDPRTLLGHLADEPRLRAFAAVLLGARTAEEVAGRGGLPPALAPRLLTRLAGAGLVERGPDGWVARPQRLREVVAAATPRADAPDVGAGDPGATAVLRAFVRPDGSLERVPAARAKRLVVLDHVCRVFEPGQRYPEREVVAMLRTFHDDHAALRRHLVDEGFLGRADGTYWRIGGTVEI